MAEGYAVIRRERQKSQGKCPYFLQIGDTGYGPSRMSFEELEEIVKEYDWPAGLSFGLPEADLTPEDDFRDGIPMFKASMEAGFRLPMHPSIRSLLARLRCPPYLLTPNCWRLLDAAIVLAEQQQIKLSPVLMGAIFSFSMAKLPGVASSKCLELVSLPSKIRDWKPDWFIIFAEKVTTTSVKPDYPKPPVRHAVKGSEKELRLGEKMDLAHLKQHVKYTWESVLTETNLRAAGLLSQAGKIPDGLVETRPWGPEEFDARTVVQPELIGGFEPVDPGHARRKAELRNYAAAAKRKRGGAPVPRVTVAATVPLRRADVVTAVPTVLPAAEARSSGGSAGSETSVPLLKRRREGKTVPEVLSSSIGGESGEEDFGSSVQEVAGTGVGSPVEEGEHGGIPGERGGETERVPVGGGGGPEEGCPSSPSQRGGPEKGCSASPSQRGGLEEGCPASPSQPSQGVGEARSDKGKTKTTSDDTIKVPKVPAPRLEGEAWVTLMNQGVYNLLYKEPPKEEETVMADFGECWEEDVQAAFKSVAVMSVARRGLENALSDLELARKELAKQQEINRLSEERHVLQVKSIEEQADRQVREADRRASQLKEERDAAKEEAERAAVEATTAREAAELLEQGARKKRESLEAAVEAARAAEQALSEEVAALRGEKEMMAAELVGLRKGEGTFLEAAAELRQAKEAVVALEQKVEEANSLLATAREDASRLQSEKEGLLTEVGAARQVLANAGREILEAQQSVAAAAGDAGKSLSEELVAAKESVDGAHVLVGDVRCQLADMRRSGSAMTVVAVAAPSSDGAVEQRTTRLLEITLEKKERAEKEVARLRASEARLIAALQGAVPRDMVAEGRARREAVALRVGAARGVEQLKKHLARFGVDLDTLGFSFEELDDCGIPIPASPPPDAGSMA